MLEESCSLLNGFYNGTIANQIVTLIMVVLLANMLSIICLLCVVNRCLALNTSKIWVW